MPDLLSKLQYRYSEKGEFADQKNRSLEETLQLIKTIKWDEQRGGEVGLTCPSITIVDEAGNYLKVATYFNGKFCVYYLDTDQRLYEHPVSNIDDADPFVTDFFNGQLDVTKFERHRGIVGAVKHFEDATFFYRVAIGGFYAKMIFFALLFLLEMLAAGMLMISNAPPMVFRLFGLGIIVMMLFLMYNQVKVIKYYFRIKNVVLVLSANADIFSYGCEDEMTEYSKKDVVEINIYGAIGSKGRSLLSISEIVFKNDFKLYIPVLLIDVPLFVSKFPYIKATSISTKADYQPVLDGYLKGRL